MQLKYIYSELPKKEDCLNLLEKLKWNNNPQCPYCSSGNFSISKFDYRYHCNNCNTTYSVTVNTPFHRTKVDLQKWFYAINKILYSTETISSRSLAKEIETTKNTAWRIIDQIKKAVLEQNELIFKIIEHERK